MKRLLGKLRLVIAAVAIMGVVLLTVRAWGEEHLCKGNKRLIGECRHVYGYLQLSADAGYVISYFETPTIYIEAPRGSDKEMPEWLAKIMDSDLLATALGDFEICPLQRRLGPTACIEAASDVLIEFRDGRTERRP